MRYGLGRHRWSAPSPRLRGRDERGEAKCAIADRPVQPTIILLKHPYRRGRCAPTHFLLLAAICPYYAALTRITCRCIDGPAAPFVGFCGSFESNPPARFPTRPGYGPQRLHRVRADNR